MKDNPGKQRDENQNKLEIKIHMVDTLITMMNQIVNMVLISYCYLLHHLFLKSKKWNTK